MASPVTSILSSTQLVGIANKLSSIDDRQRYCHLIHMTSDIQAKLNQIRLDRMNANSFNPVTNDTIDCSNNNSMTNHISPTCNMSHQNSTTENMDVHRNQESSLEPPHEQHHNSPPPPSPLTIVTSASKHSSASSIPFLPSATLESHPLKRRDSAVDMTQQQDQQQQPQQPPYPSPSLSPSSNCLKDDYSVKALPAFPASSKKRDSHKYDSFFDTTSYYYENQPISVDLNLYPLPTTVPKKPKVTFADQPISPIPSPTTTTTNSNSNNNFIGMHDDNNTSFLLMTPPVSPRYIEYTPQAHRISAYNHSPLPLPPLLHCQKKTNGFIGLLTRTYQLNEIISSRVLISALGLVNAIDSSTGQAKAILKVTMTSCQVKPLDEQNNDDTLDMEMLARFGFSFYSGKKLSPNVRRPSRDDPQCLQNNDALVSSALDYWIQRQRDHLPPLTQATHVLRESAKIYVVYDKSLITDL